jgi:spore photoproduct lyase
MRRPGSKTLPTDLKWQKIYQQTPWAALPTQEKQFLQEQGDQERFTFQELRELVDIAVDLGMWQEGTLSAVWPPLTAGPPELQGKKKRQWMMEKIRGHWLALKKGPQNYDHFVSPVPTDHPQLCAVEEEHNLLGPCPADSPQTRCCQLLTLDAVRNCVYGCSYCSLQPFFNQQKVWVEKDLRAKLKKISLPPHQLVHIGTGQSSDSLALGNHEGILEALLEWAQHNPQMVLEFKTKSDQVEYLLQNPVPPNVIVTWTLNTPTIIQHEEHGTASLERRLVAARKVADKKILVGFHFHPMIHYRDWADDYQNICTRLLKDFRPPEVITVSLGTATYTRKVMQAIRSRGLPSKILQMPLIEIAGKYSYPSEIKRELFSYAYQALKPWWGKVFFYLCMEEINLWKEIFGHDYKNNEQFSQAMNEAYQKKIKALTDQ